MSNTSRSLLTEEARALEARITSLEALMPSIDCDLLRLILFTGLDLALNAHGDGEPAESDVPVTEGALVFDRITGEPGIALEEGVVQVLEEAKKGSPVRSSHRLPAWLLRRQSGYVRRATAELTTRRPPPTGDRRPAPSSAGVLAALVVGLITGLAVGVVALAAFVVLVWAAWR